MRSVARIAYGHAECACGEIGVPARAAGHWMHVCSREAGPRVADIASVIESSKRLGINPREYLADVLPRLANGTTSEVPSLTPAAWLRHRSGQPAA